MRSYRCSIQVIDTYCEILRDHIVGISHRNIDEFIHACSEGYGFLNTQLTINNFKLVIADLVGELVIGIRICH